jgi:hypothetical protein
MEQNLEFGLDTFGDITAGPDGNLLPHAQVIRNVIEEAVLADTVTATGTTVVSMVLVQIPLSWIFETGNAVDFIKLFRCRLRTKTNFAPAPG